VNGGDLITTNKKGFITIIPTSKKVIITVRNNGSYIGDESFRVKPVPKPTLKVYHNHQELDLKKGGKVPRKLRLKAIPDADFAEFLPNDARYKVTEWEIILVRNGIPRITKKYNKDVVNLSEIVRYAQKGDRLVIDVKKVKRLNFRNIQEEIKMGVQVFSYAITR